MTGSSGREGSGRRPPQRFLCLHVPAPEEMWLEGGSQSQRPIPTASGVGLRPRLMRIPCGISELGTEETRLLSGAELGRCEVGAAYTPTPTSCERQAEGSGDEWGAESQRHSSPWLLLTLRDPNPPGAVLMSLNSCFSPPTLKSASWHLQPSVQTTWRTVQALRLPDSELSVLQEQTTQQAKTRPILEGPGGFPQLPTPPTAMTSLSSAIVPRLTQSDQSLLPGKADPHGKHNDAPVLQLLGRQGHVPL